MVAKNECLHAISSWIPKPSILFEIVLDICEIKHLKGDAMKSCEIVTIIPLWT